MSFSAALWSSAQIEHSLSCPPGVPPFMSAHFLLCEKDKIFLGQIFTSGTSHQFSGLDSAFSKHHTPEAEADQALTFPD